MGKLSTVGGPEIADWRLVSFATGTKCLNEKQLHAKISHHGPGDGLSLGTSAFHHRIHDSHAEILAKRAFRLYFFIFILDS